jgi:hypothetical protein
MNDDRIITQEGLDKLMSHPSIMVSLKMDGENTSIYPDATTHARSVDSGFHPSRAWIRQYAATISPFMAEIGDFRLCGENMYALHSIPYEDLESYFLLFSIWNEDFCYGWGDTCSLISRINYLVPDEYAIHTVPVVYYGPSSGFDLREFSETFMEKYPGHEGFVVRNADSFMLSDFENSIAKFVRRNHVQTDEHWMLKEVTPNKLKSKETV